MTLAVEKLVIEEANSDLDSSSISDSFIFIGPGLDEEEAPEELLREAEGACAAWELLSCLGSSKPPCFPWLWFMVSVSGLCYYLLVSSGFLVWEGWWASQLTEHLTLPGGTSLQLWRMPAEWDRRYYRTGEGTGVEVLLVKKVAGSGNWVVVKPDLSLGTLNLNHPPTVKTEAQLPAAGGVLYLPAAVIPAAQKQALKAQAEALLTASALQTFPRFGETMNGGALVGRLMATLLTAPRWMATNLRWILRSKWRVAGLTFACWACNDITGKLGIWTKCHEYYEFVKESYVGTMEKLTEASETFAEVKTQINGWYDFVEVVISPWKLLLWMTFFFTMWLWSQESEESSPAPSSVGSVIHSVDTSVSTTPTTAPAKEGVDGRKLMEELTRLKDSMDEMKEHFSVQTMKGRVQSEGAWRESDRKSLNQLRERVEEFRELLQMEKPPIVVEIPQGMSSTSYHMEEPPLPPPMGAPRPMKSAANFITKLKARCVRPQEIFLKALEEMEEVDEEEWNS